MALCNGLSLSSLPMMLACSWSVSRIQRRSQVPSQVLSQVHSQGFPWRDRPPEKTKEKSTSNCIVTKVEFTAGYTSVLDKPNIFSPSKKCFLVSCPPYSKCVKKLLNFHLQQQKKNWFLVFSFSFWFQYLTNSRFVFQKFMKQ